MSIWQGPIPWALCAANNRQEVGWAGVAAWLAPDQCTHTRTVALQASRAPGPHIERTLGRAELSTLHWGYRSNSPLSSFFFPTWSRHFRAGSGLQRRAATFCPGHHPRRLLRGSYWRCTCNWDGSLCPHARVCCRKELHRRRSQASPKTNKTNHRSRLIAAQCWRPLSDPLRECAPPQSLRSLARGEITLALHACSSRPCLR